MRTEKTDQVYRKLALKIIVIVFLGAIVLEIGALQTKVEAASSPTYSGPVFCALCHEGEYERWNHTAHSNAYDDPIFQEQWRSQGSPDACLKCHTTGFEVATGNFSFKQVGCEMCHGPGGEMNLNTSAEFCSSCHSFSHFPTYEEWLESEHGHLDVECVECHDPMSLELKLDDPTELCGRCHEDVVADSLVGDHGEKDLDCSDCHLGRIENIDGDVSYTGHTFMPIVPDPDCMSCHEILLETHDVWGAESDNCITCHDTVQMTMLHLFNGSDIAMSESSILCAQCHNDVYYEWSMGIHADPHVMEKDCVDCHRAMNPYIMMNATLPPVTQPTEHTVIWAPVSPGVFFGAIAVISGISFYAFLNRRKEVLDD